MTSSGSRLPDPDRYLARHGFAPHPVTSTRPGRGTGPGIIRVVCEPGEETQLISLTVRSVCMDKILLTPDTVSMTLNCVKAGPPDNAVPS